MSQSMSRRENGWSLFVVAVIAAAFSALGAESAAGAVAATILLVLVAAAFMAVTRKEPDIRAIGLLALGLRVASAALDSRFELLPKGDQVFYQSFATAMADGMRSGLFPSYATITTDSTQPYILFLALGQMVFGADPMVSRVLTSSLGALAAMFVARIGLALHGQRAGAMAGFAYACFPSLIVFEAEILRDAMVHLALIGALYAATMIGRRPNLRPMLFLAGAVWAAWLVRKPAIVMTVPLIPIFVLASYRSFRPSQGGDSSPPSLHLPWRPLKLARSRAYAWRWALVLVPALLVLFVWFLDSGGGGLTYFLSSPEIVEQYRPSVTHGESGYLRSVEFDTWADVMRFAPLGGAFFLLSPLDPRWSYLLDLATVIEVWLIFVPLTVLAFLHRKHMPMRSAGLLILAWLLAVSLVYGIFEGNAGTALRHRQQFTWVVMLVAAPALHRLREWVERKFRRRVHFRASTRA